LAANSGRRTLSSAIRSSVSIRNADAAGERPTDFAGSIIAAWSSQFGVPAEERVDALAKLPASGVID